MNRPLRYREVSRSVRRSAAGLGAVILMAATAILGQFPWHAQAAELAASEETVAAQIEAGEFAPAFEIAQQAPRDQRDAWMQRLAMAQARAGARNASFTTAAEITNDVLRDRTARDLAAEPLDVSAQGGGLQPDFDSLIELITTTVEPTSWDEVGGPGSIKEFEGGVYVDLEGIMRPREDEDSSGRLARLGRDTAHSPASGDVRRNVRLRKVSLTRLEREVQLRLASGKPLDDEMLVLAGLQRIRYLMVYPETGDLVVAGPAGDWTMNQEGRLVSTETGRPVVRLDDLVVMLRHMTTARNTVFRCSITPTQEGLAAVQQFAAESARRPLASGSSARTRWLAGLCEALGPQRVEIGGVDPSTRVAHVMLEADYRMKRIGIGLEDGALGVPSYFQMVNIKPGEPAPPMSVVRWWFTVDYDAVRTSPDRDVFELRGEGVKVLSENEFLTATGRRRHSGASDEPTAGFAHAFTNHFAEMAGKYPIYAELQNVFDLALVGALVKSHGLADQLDWHMTCFGDPGQYQVARGPLPEAVESVANYRMLGRGRLMGVVSGGVVADVRPVAATSALETDTTGELGTHRDHAEPQNVPYRHWWWD